MIKAEDCPAPPPRSRAWSRPRRRARLLRTPARSEADPGSRARPAASATARARPASTTARSASPRCSRISASGSEKRAAMPGSLRSSAANIAFASSKRRWLTRLAKLSQRSSAAALGKVLRIGDISLAQPAHDASDEFALDVGQIVCPHIGLLGEHDGFVGREIIDIGEFLRDLAGHRAQGRSSNRHWRPPRRQR